MMVEPLEIPDVLLLKPHMFHDARGRFLELWHRERYASAGLPATFLQDNVSVSRRGVLRGLHYQHPRGQGKLVSCVRGVVFDAVVDVRSGSPTFGRWVGAELTEENGRQLWAPAGFAHGFLALSEDAVFVYKCTEAYAPETEHRIRWDDPAIGIVWPMERPVMSNKDAAAPQLSAVPVDHLPPMDPSVG